MKNKSKILTIMLASSLVFAGCNNNSADNKENTKVASEQSSSEKSKDKKSKEKLDDNTVAMVNGQAITRDDYKKELETFNSMSALRQQAKASLVQMLIQDKLIFADAEKNGVKVDDKDINDAFLKDVQQVGGDKQFDKMLDDYNLTAEDLKNILKKNMIYQKHQEWFIENHPVTDEEINNYFEENKEQFQKVDASHILVEDEATAKEVKEKLDNGEDFVKLVKEYSKDPASGAKDGELGEFGKGQMVKEFDEAVFSMKEGEISEPIKTQFGYHIIKVNKILDSVDDAKEDIKNTLSTQKYQDYVKELQENADIVTEDDNASENNEVEEKNKEESPKEEKQEDKENKEEESDKKSGN